jgi:hypothetical protein
MKLSVMDKVKSSHSCHVMCRGITDGEARFNVLRSSNINSTQLRLVVLNQGSTDTTSR